MNDEDEVIAEYDLTVNPSLNYDFYMLQYLHRPSDRPYGDQVFISNSLRENFLLFKCVLFKEKLRWNMN